MRAVSKFSNMKIKRVLLKATLLISRRYASVHRVVRLVATSEAACAYSSERVFNDRVKANRWCSSELDSAQRTPEQLS
jgi:hypothetical protein